MFELVIVLDKADIDMLCRLYTKTWVCMHKAMNTVGCAWCG